MREKLLRRLMMLWTLEYLNALVIFPMLLFVFDRAFDLGWYSYFSMGLVMLILLLGGTYWVLKYRSVKQKKDIDSLAAEKAYHITRRALPFLLFSSFPLLVVRLIQDASPGDLVFGFLMSLFAVLEYINYYHWQLSYDNISDLKTLIMTKRLKVGILKREWESEDRLH